MTSGTPAAVGYARICWATLLTLTVVASMINVVVAFGLRSILVAVLAIGPAALAFRGATQLRVGFRSGRTLAAVCGWILGALNVFTLCVLIVIGSSVDFDGPWLASLLQVVVQLGLIGAGLALMFRSEVGAYVAADRRGG